MAIEKINIGWLKDYTEKKFAPKTLLSLIFNEDGSKIQEKLRLSHLTVDNKITGSIDKADQLTTTAVGSVNQPVYFKDGIPEEIEYTIAKSVPSDAVFTDTTYDLTTSASTTNGQINLVAGGSGSGTDTITIKGSGATTVTSDASGNITISSTDTNTDTNTTYSLSGASTDDNSTYTVTLTSSSENATTAKIPAATETVAGLMTANQVQNLDKISSIFVVGEWTPTIYTDTTTVDAIYEAKGHYMKIGDMVTVTFYYKGKLQQNAAYQETTTNQRYLALEGESLPFTPDGNILLYTGGGYVNGALSYQQNHTFGGWTIDTYNKKIYPRTFPNSDTAPSIINASYCKAPPSDSPSIVYLSGSITYHIGEWATEPDPDASTTPVIPSVTFIYNGETTGWQSTWLQSDHTISNDPYTPTNIGTCQNGYLTTGIATDYHSNTTIGSSNTIDFQDLMDAGYTTLNVTFNKIIWPFTTNLANNIVAYQYNTWVGIANSVDENISFKNTNIITPLRGQEAKGGFNGLNFGANVTSPTTATLSLADLTKNSTRTNGHLVFGVIRPNISSSTAPEIQISKIWIS